MASAAPPLVLVMGNPNVGKSTLFNALTGQRARVGNYPGVTVERHFGRMTWGSGTALELADVPGTYSLSARSRDERVALDAVLGLNGNRAPALCVVVMDAGQLTRNLYLLLQVLELGLPVIVALNMVDECDTPPSAALVTQCIGVPCVATSGRNGTGLDALKQAIVRALDYRPAGSIPVVYPSALEADLLTLLPHVPSVWCPTESARRALALWALTSLEDDELTDIPGALRDAVGKVRSNARSASSQNGSSSRDLDLEIIGARYAALDRLSPKLYAAGAAPAQAPRVAVTSEKVDRVLLHPVFGFAIFLAVMLVIFQTLFSGADPAISLIEDTNTALQEWLLAQLPDGFLRDLLVEGVLGGVGNVVVFLPQLLLLFFFIAILESTGYMARVAYLMDRVMRAAGLHGRAFVPMMSGMACAIPAVMATRTMERERDRVLTMLVVPLMTCSARLPVYGLVIAALYPPSQVFGFVPIQGLLMVGMYVFSTVTALVAAAVLGRTVVRGRKVPLLLELPPYRAPQMSSVLRQMWERSLLFLREAGTVILGFTVALWLLLSYPKASPELAEGTPETQAAQIQQSYGGQLGKAIEPAIAPLGFDWKIGVGLVGAFAAREVFVSTMGLVYGIGEVADDDAAPLRDKMRAETRPDGKAAYTPLIGLSLMVFFALACQCMSTIAVVRRETGTWRWPLFMFAYMTALAWTASFLVFQGGCLLGF